MELTTGTKIRYTSAAGTREAYVTEVKVGPTAKTGFFIPWMTLIVPPQLGAKFETTVRIPADDKSLSMFRVEVI